MTPLMERPPWMHKGFRYPPVSEATAKVIADGVSRTAFSWQNDARTIAEQRARIQTLEAELDRVRGALKSFARDAERLTTIGDDERLAFTDAHGNAILYVSITAGDIKTARQALSLGEE
ncbi:hypothetical protein UFOVP679_12 [uncultured Caudovirales phage]|uniref:Uncharacterized protein n=1 Tax=uncultured Caudovirales phage TaxID=2100421 RepID=A0A6J5NF19_9CAUD|nr:hypothetical protein UFOVP679_12 [uncultured Caudovirales phage]